MQCKEMSDFLNSCVNSFDESDQIEITKNDSFSYKVNESANKKLQE